MKYKFEISSSIMYIISILFLLIYKTVEIHYPEFKNKVVWVSGGTSGIGYQISLQLA